MHLFTICTTILCVVLFIQVLKLQNTLNKKKKAKESFDAQRQAAEDARNKIEVNLRCKPSDFYKAKESCMNINESRMFYYINQALDDLIPNPEERDTFWVFPQVSLYSFIKIRPGIPSASYDVARSNYIAKSIDFVICHCSKQPYIPFSSPQKSYNYYAYTPILLIELDGKSHSSSKQYGEDAFRRQQANDQFKNSLLGDLGIPLIRYTLEKNGQVCAKDAVKIKQDIDRVLTHFYL